MKHPRLLCLVSLIALTGGCKAQAVRGNLADLTIIDRDNGAILIPYLYHGEYWIAGRPGSRYAVEVRNHLGERLLVVMSVDGVNVVSGATAAWDQGGYVFSPGDQYQVTGWRKSDTEIAAFTFTESPNSYAERTGRPANVGVIGVALFRERPPIAIPAEVTPAESAALRATTTASPGAARLLTRNPRRPPALHRSPPRRRRRPPCREPTRSHLHKLPPPSPNSALATATANTLSSLIQSLSECSQRPTRCYAFTTTAAPI